MRSHFLGWQCRVRQYAVRRRGGSPSSGMRPAVTVPGNAEPLGQITVLIIKADPETTAQFSHIVRRTHDPAQRYTAGLRLLAASYYQRPQEFSDQMTALFSKDSAIVGALLAAGCCELAFEQYSQRYQIVCAVQQLQPSDALYQATYWHNKMFNPHLPGAIEVLAFRPHWGESRAEPPVSES